MDRDHCTLRNNDKHPGYALRTPTQLSSECEVSYSPFVPKKIVCNYVGWLDFPRFGENSRCLLALLLVSYAKIDSEGWLRPISFQRVQDTLG